MQRSWCIHLQIEELRDSEPTAEILKEATANVDQILEAAVQQATLNASRGHQVGLVRSLQNARVAIGDQVADGQKVVGFGHKVNHVTAVGNSRTHIGNNYGGKVKGVFDDRRLVLAEIARANGLAPLLVEIKNGLKVLDISLKSLLANVSSTLICSRRM